jgi:hypothetical protein
MKAPMDIRCPNPRCRKRIGWYGTYLDRPACWNCGHRPEQKELQEVQTKFEEDERILNTELDKLPVKERREKRRKAGLSVHQTSRLTNIDVSRIAKFESGTGELTQSELETLDKLYSGEQP